MVPITPTICSTVIQPCPTPTPCAETGAGVSTSTPKALENSVLEDVDFDQVDFENAPSSADLPNDGVVAGVLGAYAVTFTLNFGETLDVATATTFIFVDGIERDSFLHILGPTTTSQHVSTTVVLGQGSLVQLFVRQDGALEGLLLNSAFLSIFRPCSTTAQG